MLHEDLQGRAALLGVPRLVGLDRRDHVGEVDVAGFQRVRGQRDELDVGEPGLEGERQLDRDVDHVRVHHHAVEGGPGGDDAPLVGLVRLVRPVVLRILADQRMREVQADLGVPGLVQRAEGRHVAPGRRQAEPGHAELRVGGEILDEGNRAEMLLGHRLPALVQLVEDPGFLQHRLDRVRPGLLLSLCRHVLRIRDLVRLIPPSPGLAGNLALPGQPLREHLLVVDVGQFPVQVPCDVVPLLAGHPGHGLLLEGLIDLQAAQLLLPGHVVPVGDDVVDQPVAGHVEQEQVRQLVAAADGGDDAEVPGLGPADAGLRVGFDTLDRVRTCRLTSRGI